MPEKGSRDRGLATEMDVEALALSTFKTRGIDMPVATWSPDGYQDSIVREMCCFRHLEIDGWPYVIYIPCDHKDQTEWQQDL